MRLLIGDAISVSNRSRKLQSLLREEREERSRRKLDRNERQSRTERKEMIAGNCNIAARQTD